MTALEKKTTLELLEIAKKGYGYYSYAPQYELGQEAVDMLIEREQQRQQEAQGVDEVDEGLMQTARDLASCAVAWESDVRLVGNVRAADIYAMCVDYLNRPYLRSPSPATGKKE